MGSQGTPVGSPSGVPANASDGGMLALRLGIGLAWALNFLFVLLPSNQFFSGFGGTAASFGPTSLGGAGLATFVAGHAWLFSWGLAITTGYLAIAFLLGISTRTACVVGLVLNSLLLLTQYGSIVVIPGGTDIGPQPLYLIVYIALFLGNADQIASVDHWLWKARRVRLPLFSRHQVPLSA
jgi:hypothetical protein